MHFLRYLLFSGAVTLGASASAQQPVALGSRLELLVDDYLVGELHGIDYRLHEPVKAPRPQSPLPEKHMMTVIKDGDHYRAWYRSSDPAYKGEPYSGNPGEIVCYAESRDGQEWTFP